MSERNFDINNRGIPGHVRRRLEQAAQWRQIQAKRRDLGEGVVGRIDDQPTSVRPSFFEYSERVRAAAMLTGADVSGVINKVVKHWDSTEWNNPSESGRDGD